MYINLFCVKLRLIIICIMYILQIRRWDMDQPLQRNQGLWNDAKQ